MNDVRNEEMVRLSFRRELTPEEESRLESYFAANPHARAQWEEQRALSRAVQSLPDVPVSSNFTARVLAELDLDRAREGRQRSESWFRIFWPRAGWGVVAALLLFIGYRYQERAGQRNQAVKVLAEVSKLSGENKRLPEPEELQDFKAINWLRETPASSDDELLIALQ